MAIKYREFEIRHSENGCTVLREVPNYGASIVYKKTFPTLEAGLEYIFERLIGTECKDLREAIDTMKYVKNDLKGLKSKVEAQYTTEQTKPITRRIIK